LPRKIIALDEPGLVLPPPTVDFLLAWNRVANIAELFEVDEAKNSIPRCESGNEPPAMFDDSAVQVGNHAGVQTSQPDGKDAHSARVSHFSGEEEQIPHPRPQRAGPDSG
jgi:hypothetical protein